MQLTNIQQYFKLLFKFAQTTKSTKMNILIFPDKFKSSLSSSGAAESIAKGLLRAKPNNINIERIEMADGGDGSASVMQKNLDNVNIINCNAIGPLGESIKSSYLLYKNSENIKCAFIEMARVSGLNLVQEKACNPWFTTTYGLGCLIKDAINKGALNINISIGGSATNDGGTGMLQSLGYEFKLGISPNIQGLTHQYMCGGRLKDIVDITEPTKKYKHINFSVICDVDNPLLGAKGATMIYSAQKGADQSMMQLLEKGMEHYAKLSLKLSAKYNSDFAGAGAAGGLGYALKTFLNAKIISGWEFFSELTRLEEKISKSDLLICGEGKIDSQSLNGKLLDGVIKLSKKHNKELILFCGKKEIELEGIEIYALEDIEPKLSLCMKNASTLLEELSFRVFKTYFQKIKSRLSSSMKETH